MSLDLFAGARPSGVPRERPTPTGDAHAAGGGMFGGGLFGRRRSTVRVDEGTATNVVKNVSGVVKMLKLVGLL